MRPDPREGLRVALHAIALKVSAYDSQVGVLHLPAVALGYAVLVQTIRQQGVGEITERKAFSDPAEEFEIFRERLVRVVSQLRAKNPSVEHHGGVREDGEEHRQDAQ